MRWLALLILASCGGKAVVDEPPESDGDTSASTSSSVAAAGSTGAGSDCAALEQDFQAKLGAAAACSPAVDVLQCDCSVTVPGNCGCAVMVNQTQPGLVQAAQAAHDAWVAAGCTSSPCPTGCPATCPGEGQALCEPNANSTGGFCSWEFLR